MDDDGQPAAQSILKTHNKHKPVTNPIGLCFYFIKLTGGTI